MNQPLKKPVKKPHPMLDQSQLERVFGVQDFFVYELDFSNIAPNGVAQGSFTVQADSSFLWQQGCFFADIAGAAQEDNSRVLPLCTVLIQDSASGRNLMSNPVPVPSLFGYGSLPFILPQERFFRAQSQVSVTVTNYDAASTYNLRLSFIGTKYFKFGNAA